MLIKEFILNERQITIKQAAEELGYCRPYINDICNGLAGGKRLGQKIEKWSGGKVIATSIIFPPRPSKKQHATM